MCDEIHRSTWATQEPGWLMTSLRLLPRIFALGKFLSTNQHFTSFMEWHVMELPNCFRKMCFWFGDCGFRMLSVVPEAEFIPAIPCLRSWSRQVYVRKWVSLHFPCEIPPWNTTMNSTGGQVAVVLFASRLPRRNRRNFSKRSRNSKRRCSTEMGGDFGERFGMVRKFLC